jgi:hypothetical protein
MAYNGYRDIQLQFIGGPELNQDFYLLEYKYFNNNGERKNIHYIDLFNIFRCKTLEERCAFVKSKIEDAVNKKNEQQEKVEYQTQQPL